MPLYKIEWTSNQCGWAIWHITESEVALAALAQPDVCPADIASPPKRLEWLGGRILLKMLVEKAGLYYRGLLKNEFGKPSLEQNSHHISLSHSYPYVAAQIDFEPVGIDVEQPKIKLLRIAHRVFTPLEEVDAGKDLTKNCIYWCAKEALYKLYGERGLSFSRNLSIEPFLLSRQGYLLGKISINGSNQLIKLGYSVEQDFVLVYTKTR